MLIHQRTNGNVSLKHEKGTGLAVLTVCRPSRFWCITCKAEASEQCVDDHAVRSLRKERSREAAPHLDELQRGEAALASLRGALDAAAADLELESHRAHLERERAGLAAARSRLEDSLGADADAWAHAKDAKQAAVQGGKAFSYGRAGWLGCSACVTRFLS